MDFLYGYVDTLDLVVLAVIAAVSFYFFYTYRSDSSQESSPNLSNGSAITAQKTDRSFLGRMKAENRQVLILFGSQTGTAEELAGRLAKDLHRYGKKPLVMDPEEIDIEDLPKITEVEDPLLVLCLATYGEGDPTDNSQALFDFINNTDSDFSGLNYAVFGLGNKTYEHFNEVGKVVDRRLQELGAKRVFELGLGDDDVNLEEDFMRWGEKFLPSLAETFGWELSQQSGNEREYRLEILDNATTIFKGEYGRIGAYENQRPPFDHKNPHLATVLVNKELHSSKSDRSCRHIEFGINNNRINYEAGDHLGIFPTNDSELVDKIGKLLKINLETIFKLVNLDTDSSKRHPFPCPTSYRTALLHYVDIVAPVKSHVLRTFAEFTSDPKEKEYLGLLSTATEEGLSEYGQFVQKERRNVVDILERFSSCRPPIELLLELLPRLQARYYSISSSPKVNNRVISATALVTKYKIKDRTIKGVCTNYLAKKSVNHTVPIFIRKSKFRLPKQHDVPVIFIGPGTGFSPFRGFIQERAWHKEQGQEVGEVSLFFGCRHPEHDHIYKDEMTEWTRKGILTRCLVAYSRYAEEKVYVQHQMWIEREHIWSIVQRGGNVYVCGDARNMARDVLATMLRIFREVGQLSEDAAASLIKDLERQRRYQADVWS